MHRLVEQQKKKAWDLWLDCYSLREIESEVGVAKSTLADWLPGEKAEPSDFPTDWKIGQPPGSTDKNPWGSVQHFDIWQFQNADKDAGSQSYFGALPPQVVENVLWFWTEPGHSWQPLCTP